MNREKHSRLGVASVIIAAAVPALLLLLYTVSILLGTKKGSPGNLTLIVAVIFSLLGPLLHVVGAGLGIGGLFTKRIRFYPVVGTVFNLMLATGGALILFWIAKSITYGFR
ncbi:MAG: hypothetical protein DWQ47_09905 [Acidobacteria bacterium]|nr:MAG: hypothetical protein DWQ32_12320 [Acidobacteriota bacterium]REJ98696.1 MAG: hypothetical protein DWQ38_15160 [Acidobacteriota bacterium]REK16649.1 MAG: hypothetical protein DWQ43_00165 [Acidobacteriota bacterium]REK42560.1 MAG: hypothetical protein DWQ47_09905 [Acidobacteriota bacterium]